MPLEGLDLVKQGKVRDIYRTSAGMLMVASDRLSAFDVVLPTPIPGKGAVLTGLSTFWFSEVVGIIENHLISTDPSDFPPEARRHAEALRGRAMLVRPAEVVPIECVARGYLSGSGWKEYRQSGSICGISLPTGLVESDRLPEPMFTPSTKADVGHDENIDFDRGCELVGRDVMERIREATLEVYSFAATRAEKLGIIVADTKFEFGVAGGEIILIDEVLTPDSSRFWPVAEYQPGRAQASFDKQPVRDWLDASGWDRTPPGPVLPAEVVAGTRSRYTEAFERLSGCSFDAWLATGRLEAKA